MGNSASDAGSEDWAHEEEVAVAAAEEAGAMLRSRFRQAHTVDRKGEDGDVVTDLDLASEKLILARLQTHFPHDRILSEEAGLFDAVGRRTWLVDPLDGSNNVAIGLPAYAVGIGLCVEGSPVVGVVHEPVTGSTWRAALGQGARCGAQKLAGPARQVHRSGPVVAWTQGHAVSRSDPTARALRHTLELRSRRVLQLWAPLLGWSMLARGDGRRVRRLLRGGHRLPARGAAGGRDRCPVPDSHRRRLPSGLLRARLGAQLRRGAGGDDPAPAGPRGGGDGLTAAGCRDGPDSPQNAASSAVAASVAVTDSTRPVPTKRPSGMPVPCHRQRSNHSSVAREAQGVMTGADVGRR